MVEKQEFSKYERARIIGARGLQISMDAPLLVDVKEEELNAMNFDALRIAEKELDSGVLPISVSKPMPKRQGEALENIKVETEVPSDDKKIAMEKEAEKEILADGSMKADDEGDDVEADISEVDAAKAELE